MKYYRTNKWREFRDEIIEADGGKCRQCFRSAEEATLQVHHIRYIPGRLPWQYGMKDCITLCKGCHAAEHGLIKPKYGWEYLGDDDLGELSGTCENCGASIRYYFLIYHEKWGTIEVGTLCCDNLTDSELASNNKESRNKYYSRLSRFKKSTRWKENQNLTTIKQASFNIVLHELEEGYKTEVNSKRSATVHENIEVAKIKIFELIESGELIKLYKSKFLYQVEKGNIISSTVTNHPIIFIKKIDEEKFAGCLITHASTEDYSDNIGLSDEHLDSNFIGHFRMDNSYFVGTQTIKLLDWGPFEVIGNLSDSGIQLVENYLEGKEPVFWDEYIASK